MTGSRHHIRKQTLHVELESEAQALELQPRLSDFNRRRLLAIIEQVFDAVDVPGLHLRIDRLDVDLGTVPLDNFEQVVEERLTARLREVVEQAVHARRVAPPSGEQPRTEAEMRLELLEHYLLHGTLPYWAPGGAGFSFGALFAQVAMSDPQGLVRLVGKHASMGEVLDRLVLQLDQRSLERLITLLEPKHAALLIDYIVSLQALHRVKPVVPLSDRGLSRLLWLLTLTYLVKEAGSQFNRKSALKQLLEGIAESQGLEYSELLTTLGIGLEQVRKRHPVLASLSFVIGELVRELPAPVADVAEMEEHDAEELTVPETASARYELTEALRYYLQHGVLPWGTLVRMPELTAERVVATLPELPRSLQRRALAWEQSGGSLTRLVRAVRRISEETLAKLLVRLMPPSGDEGSPLRSALPVFVARAEDKPLFFARLISTLLDGRPVDLEELAAPRAGAFAEARSAPESDLSRWEAHAIKSTLMSQLRFGGQAGPTVADLLAALLVSFPEDTRHFLLALRDVEVLRTALVEQSDPELIERAMDLLRPRESGTLKALLRALNTLPERVLPHGRAGARQEVFHELLLLGETAPLAQGSFSRLLKRLFGSVIPGEVHGFLLRTGMAWEAEGQLPAKQVQAFRGALDELGARGMGGVVRDGRTVRPVFDEDEPLLPLALGNIARAEAASESDPRVEEMEVFARSDTSADAALTGATSGVLTEEGHSPPRRADTVASQATSRTREGDAEHLPPRQVDSVVASSTVTMEPARTQEMEAEHVQSRRVDTETDSRSASHKPPLTHEATTAVTSPERASTSAIDSSLVRPGQARAPDTDAALDPQTEGSTTRTEFPPTRLENSPASDATSALTSPTEGTRNAEPSSTSHGLPRTSEVNASSAHPERLDAVLAEQSLSLGLGHSRSQKVAEASAHPERPTTDQVEQPPIASLGRSRSAAVHDGSAHPKQSDTAQAEQSPATTIERSRSPAPDEGSTHQEQPNTVRVEQPPSESVGRLRSRAVDEDSAHPTQSDPVHVRQPPGAGLERSRSPAVDDISAHAKQSHDVQVEQPFSAHLGRSRSPAVDEGFAHTKQSDDAHVEKPSSAGLERSRPPAVDEGSTHTKQSVEQPPSASLGHSRSADVDSASLHPKRPDIVSAEHSPSIGREHPREASSRPADSQSEAGTPAATEPPFQGKESPRTDSRQGSRLQQPTAPDAIASAPRHQGSGLVPAATLPSAASHERSTSTALTGEPQPATTAAHERSAPAVLAREPLPATASSHEHSAPTVLTREPLPATAHGHSAPIVITREPPPTAAASHEHSAPTVLTHEPLPTATTTPAHNTPPPRNASIQPDNSRSPEPRSSFGSDEAPAPDTQPTNLQGHEAREALFSFLLAESADRYAGLSDDALLRLLQSLLDESPEVLRGFVRRHAHRKRLQEHWARNLPDSVLARFSAVLAPHVHAALLSATEVLVAAWQEVAPSGTPALTERSAFWRFVLELLGERPGGSLTLEQLVSAFFEHFSARLHTAQPSHRDSRSTAERLLERAIELAQHEAVPRLGALLRQRRDALVTAWTTTTRVDSRRSTTSRSRPSKESRRTSFRLGDEKNGGAPIYIDNAGLVLVSPFIPHLFRELGLSRVDDAGKTHLDPEPATRAVHLLQYLVDGRTSAPEPLLVLNKIFCGLSIPTPVPSGIELTEREQSLCDRLLKALITNWTIIANTSISGLRETFLQREGRLEQLDDRWKLQVQRKTLDVLIDQVPWNVSILTHPWMPQPLYVSW
ncbi:contractile injection system tape measure protein [Corallococcus terminator]